MGLSPAIGLCVTGFVFFATGNDQPWRMDVSLEFGAQSVSRVEAGSNDVL
jgi:hypothetical protein